MPGSVATSEDKWTELDGVAVRYRFRRGNGRGMVLILPGFAEFVEKHERTIDRFAAMGLDSITIDWPGQGLSGRLSPDYPDLVHCDAFEDHLDALDAVLRQERVLGGNSPLFLFGHSMGGHLALRMLERIDAPVAGIVLSVPMMMPPAPPPLTPGLVLALSGGLCRLGLGRRPVLGRRRKPRSGEFNPRNPLTRSPEGYRVQVDCWERNPDLLAHGPSNGWVRAAFASCMGIAGDPGMLARVDAPVQAHLAGHEVVVSARHSESLLPHIPGIAIHTYEDARHELLLELPEVTDLLWERVEAFVGGRLS